MVSDSGPVAISIERASGWYRAAAIANVASSVGLVIVLLATASLLSANLHHFGRIGVGWLVVGAIALAGQASLGGLGSYLAARGAGTVEAELRRQLVTSLFAPGLPPVNSAVASRLIVEDSRRVAEASSRWEPLRLQVVIVPAVMVAAAFATNWLVGALLLVAAPLIPLNMAVFGMGAETLTTRQAQQTAELDELVLDRIKGGDTLRALRAGQRERGTVKDAADELARRTMSVLRVALLSSAALEALVTYAVAVVATYIGLVLLGYVHVGWAPTDLGLRGGLFLLLLAPAYFQPFRDLAAAYHDRRDVTAMTETLTLELSPTIVVEPDEGEPSAPTRTEAPRPLHASTGHRELGSAKPPMLTAEGLGLRYPGAEIFTVEDLNWIVPRGVIAGVSGPSGVGKTTLLRTITGRLLPTAGSLEVHARGMAWVSQRPYFFQTSIAENLTIACPAATEDQLWDTLQTVGLAEVVGAIPEGLATQLGWSGDALSGGQARRLALARALLSGSELLVLDEPTAHLDPETEANLVETIVTLAPQRTIIVASHSPATLRVCTQVLHLNVDEPSRSAGVH